PETMLAPESQFHRGCKVPSEPCPQNDAFAFESFALVTPSGTFANFRMPAVGREPQLQYLLVIRFGGNDPVGQCLLSAFRLDAGIPQELESIAVLVGRGEHRQITCERTLEPRRRVLERHSDQKQSVFVTLAG